jgi:L-asparaginase
MHRTHKSRALLGAAAATAMALGLVTTALPAAAAPAPAVLRAYDKPDFPVTPIGPEHDSTKPNVVVIDAGGTLTSMARDRISYLHYQGSVEGGVKTILEDMYPELASVANLSVAKSPGSLGTSSSVSNKTLFDISLEADALLADPRVDGVVVTAGTSVLEEDAYFLDLTIQSQKPVVVTGAMHQYGTFTYDGYTNLFSSIRLAASKKTTCYGTVVLLNDQFFAARDVTKSDGYRMDTFGTRNSGPLGVVNEDTVRTMGAPARVQACGTDTWKTPFNLASTSPEQLAKVDIVSAYVEASPETISGPVAGGAKGIVTAGEGPGGLSSAQTTARRAAIDQGVLFATTTRTGGEGTYDSGAAGNIGAGDLMPVKARLLLQMGLTFSSDQEQIRSWFSTIGNAQFDLSSVAAPTTTTDPTATPEPTATTDPTATPEPTAMATTDPAATQEPTVTGASSPTATGAAIVPPGNGSSTGGGLALTGLGVAGGLVGLAGVLLGIGALTIWRRRILHWFAAHGLVGKFH